MIVRFGTDSDYLDTTSLDDIPCPRCEAIPLKVEHTAHYLHFHGLPFIATGRQSEVVCFACEARFKQRVLPAEIAVKVAAARREIRTPLRLYSGLFVLLFLIVTGALLSWRSSVTSDGYADSPKVKDIYVMNIFSGNRLVTAILRIREIEGDSVIMEVGRDLYRDELAAHTAIGNGAGDRDDQFGSLFGTSRQHLLQLRAHGRILDIIRPGG